jgi:hypothetical protein
MDKKILSSIIKRHSTKLSHRKNYKNEYDINQIDEILSCSLKPCKYSNDILSIKQKNHLIINFTSKNISGTYCLNLEYEKYADLFQI